jgi:Fibronectin type III domain
LKLLRVVWILLLAACALAGCHNDNEVDPAAAADGGAVADALPAGSGSATISWDAPTTTTTGSALTDLAGYRIYYGTSETELSQAISVQGVGLQTYVIDNLGAATWYFTVKAVTAAGVESPPSQVVSKTIT